MIRSFGLQTLGAAAQPLFGDKLTAAMPIPAAGIDPIATVANTAIYQVGDRITIDPQQANVDTLLVAVILSSTTMQLSSQGAPIHTHSTNAIIALAIPCAEMIVQLSDGTSGNAFLGSDNTVTSVPGGSVFQILYKTAAATPTVSFRFTNSVAFNSIRTDDCWIIGTTGNTFIASAEIV